MDQHKLSRTLLNLYGIMSKLRGPDGCPWDVQQTDSTIKMYLLEEAYEVLDAIERGAPEEVCQELGDLLFMIIFLARLAEERGEFDLLEVMARIAEKMINRHPHVFGSERVESPEEVAKNWAKIKKAEKGSHQSLSSELQGIPSNLPALLRAHRLSERASKMGLNQLHEEALWGKIDEKLKALKETLETDNEHFGQEMGDLLFHLGNLARCKGLNAENLLRKANQKFIEGLEGREDPLEGK